MSIFALITTATSPVRALLAGFPKLLKRKEKIPAIIHVHVGAEITGDVGDITGVGTEEQKVTDDACSTR